MGVLNRESREIHARLVYFGPPGAGTSTNLQLIHKKLRKEHRGDLHVSTVADDDTTEHERLPIELGSVRGYHTSIHVYSVPGGDHRELRRRITDNADGIVFVADARPKRHDATVAALEELREHLASHGRELEDVPLVVQYNHSDAADESAIETLHRRLALDPAAQFEASASRGTGVLQTLTSISKLILSRVREEADQADASPIDEANSLTTQAVEHSVMPEESQEFTVPPVAAELVASGELEKGFRIETAGPASGRENYIEIPIRLVEEGSGRRVELTLRLALDRG